AVEQWQRIITKPPFGRWNICLETVLPAPKHLKAVAVPHHGIKWRQQTHGILRCALRCILSRGPIPIHAIDTRMFEPLFCSLKRLRQRATPLGNSKAQPADQVCQAGNWQRRINLDSRINKSVDPHAALGCIRWCRSMFVSSVDADSALAPYYAQHAAIMHGP